MKTLRRLDPTWWRRTPGGYDQQDGRAVLARRSERSRVTWALYVDGRFCGAWPSLRRAKQFAAELPLAAEGTPGYCNLGGGGPFAPLTPATLGKERP